MSRILIPAGKPFLPLPFGIEPNEAIPETIPETIHPPGTEMSLLEGSSGLMSSSSALEKSFGAEATSEKPLPRRGRMTSPGSRVHDSSDGPVPSDAQILEWAKTIREVGSASGVFYTVTALQYWVRYTFGVNTKEYRQVRSRLDALVQ